MVLTWDAELLRYRLNSDMKSKLSICAIVAAIVFFLNAQPVSTSFLHSTFWNIENALPSAVKVSVQTSSTLTVAANPTDAVDRSSSPVTPFFTVTKTSAIEDSAFQSEAFSSFASHVNQTDCTVNVPLNPISKPKPSWISTALVDVVTVTEPGNPNSYVASTSIILPSNTNLQASSTVSPSKGPINSTGVKIGVAVSVPVISLLLLTLVAFYYMKRRKRGREQISTGAKVLREAEQPFFQQKGELGAEERMKHELHAEDRKNEMDGANEMQEMPSRKGDSYHPSIPGMELHGEERFKELE
ncbi:MAG: hypothetical protein Q9222_002262 [Ikaeria aurantiellina]